MSYGTNLKQLMSELKLNNEAFIDTNLNLPQLEGLLKDTHEPISVHVLSVSKTLIQHSMLNDQVIDLNFERTFNNNKECSKIRLLNIIELDIQKWLERPSKIDHIKLNNHLEYVLETPVGYYNSHILFQMAELYHLIEDIDHEYTAYYYGFSNFFVAPSKRYFDKLFNYTNPFGIVAAYLDKNQDYLEVLYDLERYADRIGFVEPVKIQYNIGLTCCKLQDCAQSTKYIDKFLAIHKNISKEDSINALLVKGENYKRMELYEAAINAYKEALKELKHTDFINLKAISRGNIIMCITDYNLTYYDQLLSENIERLKDLMAVKRKLRVKPMHNYWAVIAQGYIHLKDQVNAAYCFDKAFGAIHSDYKFKKTVTLLHDSLYTYKAVNTYSTISDTLSSIKTSAMDEKTIESYQVFLEKLAHVL